MYRLVRPKYVTKTYTKNQLFFKGYVYIPNLALKNISLSVTAGITLSNGLSSQHVFYKTDYIEKDYFTIGFN